MIKECSRGYPLEWDAVSNFQKTDIQSDTSFDDQKLSVINNICAIDKYLHNIDNCVFLKCRVISGAPGSGKSFMLNYIAIYAITRGLRIVMTALMAQRAIHLGGIHIHKLFYLPVKRSMTIQDRAETALQSLLRHPVTLKFIQTLDVLFLDEVGQISSELLTCLDIILRKVRSNNIFLGGILFICTLDHKQLPPINGNPFLTSPMIMSCFEFINMNDSVRASGDINLQRIQQIARLNPVKYEEDESLIPEFKELLLNTCTFVDNWDSDAISPNTYRLYGKKLPARQECAKYVEQVKHQLHTHQYQEIMSEDIQNPQLSHQEWSTATELTRNSLDHQCKEPRNLLLVQFISSHITEMVTSLNLNLDCCWISLQVMRLEISEKFQSWWPPQELK